MDSTPLIVAAEDEFRGQIELYGSVLAQEDPLDALAEQAADLAGQLLAAQQGLVVDVPADPLGVRAGTVHLVDERDSRHMVAVRLAPDCFRLGLDAPDGTKNAHRAV